MITTVSYDWTLGSGVRPVFGWAGEHGPFAVCGRVPLRRSSGIGLFGATKFGKALRPNGTGTSCFSDDGAISLSRAAVTMVVVCRPSTVAPGVLFYTSPSGVDYTPQFGLMQNCTSTFGASAGRLAVYMTSNGVQTDSTSVCDEKWHAFAFTRTNGSASVLWVDGAQPAQTAQAGNTSSNTSTAIGIGGWLDGSTSVSTGAHIVLAIAWNVVLPPSVLRTWRGADAVMRLFKPSRRVYLGRSGAPPASTQGPRSYHYMTHVWSK